MYNSVMQVIHAEKRKDTPEYAHALMVRRQRLGFTQKELAKKMHISPMGLSHFETGTRYPNLKWLEIWANVLGAEIKLEIKEKAMPLTTL